MPLHPRIELKKRLNLVGDRWRCDCRRQDAEARTIEALDLRRAGLRAIQKRGPGTNLAKIGNRLRAIRIVKIEHRSLDKGIRGAKVGRMIRIALDLRRTPF